MTILPDVLDALLITDPTNIRYLTGFVGAAPEEREAYVLQTRDRLFLFTNALYIESAKNIKYQKSNIKYEVVEVSKENPLARELAKLTKKLEIKKLGFEDVDLTVAEYQKLKQRLKGVALVPTRNRIEKLRMIKRPEEIAFIKSACKLTDQCFEDILGKLKPGVTEADIAWEIESFFRMRSADSAFSPIVAFNEHSSMPHYQSDNRKPLTDNSLVLLDFGARVAGYCSDMTRVVFVGRPNEELKTAYHAVLRAQEAVLAYLRAQGPALNSGRSGKKADQIAKAVIKKAGFPPYPHSLGHNVGLAIHEGPRLSAKKDETLKPDMIFSVEPAIYKQGQYGIRIEDLVRLTKNGIDILTQSSKELLRL